MTVALEYGIDTKPRRSRVLVLLANLAVAFPLSIVVFIYIEWLAAWMILGRMPRPTLDDPKGIASFVWADDVLGIVGVAWLFATGIGWAVTAVYAVKRKFSAPEVGARGVIFILGCAAALGIAYWDPGRAIEWWLD